MYFNKLANILENLNIKDLKEDILNTKGTIYILGNGGSASIASHASNDLFKILKLNSRCLSDNIATFSAYSNDVSYEDCFTEQLKILLNPKDLVICLSTSGKSKNILSAYKYSKNTCKTRFISGTNSDIKDIVIPSDNTQLVEDCFQIIFHSVL